MPLILKSECTGCKKCIKKCPVEAISLIKKKAHINDYTCIYCGKCIKTCPENAIIKDSDKIKMDVKKNVDIFRKEMKKHNKKDVKKRMIKGNLRQLEIQKKIIRNTLNEIKQIKP